MDEGSVVIWIVKQQTMHGALIVFPEENSLLLKFGDIIFETPSINLVFYQSKQLLGEADAGSFRGRIPYSVRFT